MVWISLSVPHSAPVHIHGSSGGHHSPSLFHINMAMIRDSTSIGGPTRHTIKPLPCGLLTETFRHVSLFPIPCFFLFEKRVFSAWPRRLSSDPQGRVWHDAYTTPRFKADPFNDISSIHFHGYGFCYSTTKQFHEATWRCKADLVPKPDIFHDVTHVPGAEERRGRDIIVLCWHNLVQLRLLCYCAVCNVQASIPQYYCSGCCCLFFFKCKIELNRYSILWHKNHVYQNSLWQLGINQKYVKIYL